MIWATLENKKRCPMDAEPQTLHTFQPGSTPTYWLENNPYPVGVQAFRFNNSELKDSTAFYVSHFSTCPNAGKHSKKGS